METIYVDKPADYKALEEMWVNTETSKYRISVLVVSHRLMFVGGKE